MTSASRKSMDGLLARFMLPAAALLALALPASADSIWVASGAGKPVERPNVKVMKIEAGELFFDGSQGVTNRPLADVKRMSIVGEVPFNAAEEAFSRDDFKTAAENYRKAIEVSRHPAVKLRSTQRLAEAAGKSGDFLSAVAAWGQSVPAMDAESVGRSKPPVPAGTKPETINSAAGELDRTLAGSLNPGQKQAVQIYQIELYQASGNRAKETELINRMRAAAAEAPAAGAAGAGAARVAPGAGGAVLVQVNQQLTGKNYQAAVDLVEKNRAAFVTPDDQAKALNALADAKEALAGADPAKLQEAAIAYMRIVAHFEGKPVASANVPAALMKVAAIQEKLAKPEEASQIYDTITKDAKLKGSAIATEAARRLAELNKAK